MSVAKRLRVNCKRQELLTIEASGRRVASARFGSDPKAYSQMLTSLSPSGSAWSPAIFGLPAFAPKWADFQRFSGVASGPKTESAFAPPTKTLPLAIVGTANLTPAECVPEYSSLFMLVAL